MKPLLILSMIFFLSGCGQYGPLYLPGSKMDKQHHSTMRDPKAAV